jgi:hypothetical protein
VASAGLTASTAATMHAVPAASFHSTEGPRWVFPLRSRQCGPAEEQHPGDPLPPSQPAPDS